MAEVLPQPPTQEAPKGFFAKLKAGLTKTSKNFTEKLDDLFTAHVQIDEELYEEIEEILVTADVGLSTTLKIVDTLRANIKKKNIKNIERVKPELKEIVQDLLESDQSALKIEPPLTIYVVVGVNGVGKTTTIGKIAAQLKAQGKTVTIAAADTFRAAAAEQLQVWADRSNCPMIRHQEGADPSAVVFDAIAAARRNKSDVLICDTAGRLHNKKNLMQELAKIFKIIDRELPGTPRETLLVLDATTGQNAVSQVSTFKEFVPITGIVLTKLDGTAKGGVVLAIRSELDVPVKLIGIGEKIDDLQPFNAREFAEALFETGR